VTRSKILAEYIADTVVVVVVVVVVAAVVINAQALGGIPFTF
jgi:hypothetical protein